jgi:hypothetical protein
MRVIRTELFFPGEEIVRSPSLRRLEIADVSLAWIKDVELNERELGVPVKFVTENGVPVALDHILRRERLRRTQFHLRPNSLIWDARAPILNAQHVQYVQEQSIVIEQSPPDWETLKSILGQGLGKGTTPALAIFIAVSSDPMMFIKVPATWLVISTTKVLSKWIEKKLPKLLERITSTNRRR